MYRRNGVVAGGISAEEAIHGRRDTPAQYQTPYSDPAFHIQDLGADRRRAFAFADWSGLCTRTKRGLDVNVNTAEWHGPFRAAVSRLRARS